MTKTKNWKNIARKSCGNDVSIFLILITLSTVFFCCSQKKEDDDAKKVFRYNQIKAITSLDPAYARAQSNMWAVQSIFDNLVGLDDSLHIIPQLAKSWRVAPDGLSYDFSLRTDVFFQDDACFTNSKGRKFIAQDVVYSFNRFTDSITNSPGSWIFKGHVAPQNPFVALNDSTVRINLVAPFRPLLGILTMQYCGIVPHEAIEMYKKDFRAHPVGTGAFAIKRWVENQGLFLKKNTHYWKRDSLGNALPYLDGVRVYFMPDRKMAYLEMMKHRVDYTVGVESSIINELLTADGDLQPKQKGQLQLIKTPYLNTEYLGINLRFGTEKDNPLLIKKVRQALNYGFDRDLMLRSLRNSMGKPATSGFAPRGLPSFNEKIIGYNYNIEKARALLREAGFPDGKNMPPIKIFVIKDYLDICTFIAKQWESLGVKTNVEVIESATLAEKMTSGTVPFFRGSWIADYPDAESYYTVFYSKNPAPPNYTRFSNAQFDNLYEAALKENNDSLRYRIYDTIEKIIIDEAPVIFLFYDESARFATTNIKGLSRNPMNLLPLERVTKF